MIDRLKKMFGQSSRFISIYAPFSGEVQKLETLGDQVFSTGTLGPGVIIVPNEKENTLCAPVGGEVLLMSDMFHAVMIRTTGDAEVLVHVGLKTVSLKGKYFNPLVKNGDYIKAGEPLLEFDQAAIKAAGYSMQSPVVIPNLGNFSGFEINERTDVVSQDELIKLIKD